MNVAAKAGTGEPSTRKQRAYGSTPASLKRAVRRKGVFLRLKRFRRQFGKRGEAVLRFEFRHWKRILSKRRRRRRNKHTSDADALAIIYREGRSAEVNWSTVVTRMDLHRVATDSTTNAEAAQNEYLRAQVHPGMCYSIDPEPQPAAASDDVQQPQQRSSVHFRLLDTATGHKRAKTMPTVDDTEDVAKTSPLAWYVQFHQETP